MNYITKLQQENAELKERIGILCVAVDSARALLLSPKFVGTENGERKDWIATSDVDRILCVLRDTATTEGQS